VAESFTTAWLDELDAAARTASIPTDLRLTIQQVVTDGPGGQELAYVVEAADGVLSVRPGRADQADITFTQDLATARAVQRGELSAQAAFIEGRLRLGGDVRAVLDRAGILASIDDVFAATRA